MNSQDQIALDTEYASTTDPLKGVLGALAVSAVFWVALAGVAHLAVSAIG